MNKATIISSSPVQTQILGENIGTSCQGGETLLLNGDLGAGKTCFTQGFAKGLGITEDVTSPTFVLHVQYYGTTLELNHFDAYRLEDATNIIDLGFDDFFGYKQGVAIVEWPEIIREIIPETGVIEVEIENLGKEKRKFNFIAKDNTSMKMLKYLNITL